jgi:hypothetical protein
MQTVTKANGCLFVLPGSHIQPGKLLPHEYPEWKVRNIMVVVLLLLFIYIIKKIFSDTLLRLKGWRE